MAIELKEARRARAHETVSESVSGAPTHRRGETGTSNETERAPRKSRSFGSRLWRAVSTWLREERAGFHDWKEKVCFESEVDRRREIARRGGDMW